MHTDPIIAVQLTPHRAMNRAGLHRVIVLTCVLASIPGIVFFAMGAWPILGFLGLDIALLYWAMTVSLRDGQAREVVTLWPDKLHIRRVSPKGHETDFAFNPFFARLVVERDHEDRIAALRIAAPDRQVELGRFLNADDKARFLKLFAPVYARARG